MFQYSRLKGARIESDNGNITRTVAKGTTNTESKSGVYFLKKLYTYFSIHTTKIIGMTVLE